MEQTVGIVGLILKCRERDDKEIYNDIINSIKSLLKILEDGEKTIGEKWIANANSVNTIT